MIPPVQFRISNFELNPECGFVQGVVLELRQGREPLGPWIFVGCASESSDRIRCRYAIRVAAGGCGSGVDHRWISTYASRLARDVRDRWRDTDRRAIHRSAQPAVLPETGTRAHLFSVRFGYCRYQLVKL